MQHLFAASCAPSRDEKILSAYVAAAPVDNPKVTLYSLTLA
jgi:hypothetical protein